jgi:hypothetical protein
LSAGIGRLLLDAGEVGEVSHTRANSPDDCLQGLLRSFEMMMQSRGVGSSADGGANSSDGSNPSAIADASETKSEGANQAWWPTGNEWAAASGPADTPAGTPADSHKGISSMEHGLGSDCSPLTSQTPAAFIILDSNSAINMLPTADATNTDRFCFQTLVDYFGVDSGVNSSVNSSGMSSSSSPPSPSVRALLLHTVMRELDGLKHKDRLRLPLEYFLREGGSKDQCSARGVLTDLSRSGRVRMESLVVDRQEYDSSFPVGGIQAQK